MKCEWVQQNILLYVYGELADDARYELEQHLTRCATCSADLKSARDFQAKLSALPVEEPSPNLLAASRMQLQESLETTQQGGFWHRLTFDPAAWLRQMHFSPALASAILIVGFAGGILTTYKVVKNPGENTPSEAAPAARVFHHRHPLHLAGTRLQSDQHSLRYGFHARGAGLAQRSAHSATLVVRGAQHL